MSELELRSIDADMAFHTAPTLLGVKCANLISVSRSEEDIEEYLRKFEEKLSASGFRARRLCRCRERVLVYVYNEKTLGAWLETPDVKKLLSEYGYEAGTDTDAMLDKLSSRMRRGGFPHEIGAFLGYPVGDVRGFISNGGKNCLLCGYWKVYENAEIARRTFDEYDRCREILFDRLKTGLNLFQAISKEENKL